MKKSNIAKVVFAVLLLLALYLIALNGRYKPIANGFLLLDNWTGKSVPVEQTVQDTIH
jgi:hypothetical protein